MSREKPTLVIITEKEGGPVVGMSSDAPLALTFALFLAAPRDGNGHAGGGPAAMPVNIIIRTAAEMGLTPCDHAECKEARDAGAGAPPSRADAVKRAAKLPNGPALRARGTCESPLISESAGELGAMLSILSDKVSRGTK